MINGMRVAVMGEDGSAGTPVAEVGRVYVDVLEGTSSGRTLVP
jgi:hypothetical protein